MDHPSHDYYGHCPAVSPPAPIALAGFAGAKVEAVARLLSILTGLPSLLVDRAVEHRLGGSLVRILERPGGARQRVVAEAALLRRGLAQRPPPIVALSESAVLDPGLRWLIGERAHLVHLRQGFDAAVAAIREERRESPRRHDHLAPPGAELAGLRDLHAAVTATLDRAAARTVDVSGRHPNDVAKALLAPLGLEAP